MVPASLAYNYAITTSGTPRPWAGRGIFYGVSLINPTDDTVLSAIVYDAAITTDTSKPIYGFALSDIGMDTRIGPRQGIAVERGLLVVAAGTGTLVVYGNPETRLLDLIAEYDDGTADLTPLHLARLVLNPGG